MYSVDGGQTDRRAQDRGRLHQVGYLGPVCGYVDAKRRTEAALLTRSSLLTKGISRDDGIYLPFAIFW